MVVNRLQSILAAPPRGGWAWGWRLSPARAARLMVKALCFNGLAGNLP
jgi:hypothetical protein